MARTAPVPNIPPIPGMCPGLAVLGGAGGGGGGSGTGAGGKGAGVGSGGEGGAEGADGDGRGAGACGAGSPGGPCPTHDSVFAAGHPIDVATGRAFTTPTIDVFLPGPIDFEMRRSYSSSAHRRDVGLGFGWGHALAWRVEPRRRHTVVTAHDGREVKFAHLDVGDHELGPDGWVLARNAHGYTLHTHGDTAMVFGDNVGDGTTYRLRAFQDRNGNRVTLIYDDDRLVEITDGAGRQLRVRSDVSGHILGLDVKNAVTRGQWVRLVDYGYDGDGNLIGVTDADGHLTSYRYDDDHRLLLEREPNGLTWHFHYDGDGRCVETWGDYEGRPDPSLDRELPDTLVDGSPVRGVYHCKLVFDEGYCEVVDAVRLRRFYTSDHGKVERADDAGAVTTREFDGRGHLVGATDPLGATTRWSVDARGHVLRQVDALGGVTEMTRDTAGNLLTFTDEEGNTTHFIRDANGNVIRREEPTGVAFAFEYDARGLCVAEHDPLGGTTRWTYDSHGNCTAIQLPNGATYQLTFDFLGNLLSVTDPAGTSRRWAVTSSGRRTREQRKDGSLVHFQYDGAGNLVQVVDAAQGTWCYEYGGHHVRCATESPDGAVIRTYRDYEGHIVRVVNEEGEEQVFRRDVRGAIVGEIAFDGYEKEYQRDLMGQVIRFSDQAGRGREYTRDALGRVVQVDYEDGSVTTFVFDRTGAMVGATADGVTVALERDPAGRLLRDAQTVAGQTHHVTSTLDGAGNLVRRHSSLGLDEIVQRDIMGVRTKTVLNGEYELDHEVDVFGQEIRRLLPGSGRIENEFDAAHRLVRRRCVNPSRQPADDPNQPDWVGPRPSGASVDRAFRYSPLANITQIWDGRRGTTDYSYDPIGRLLEAKNDQGPTERFGYDARGNVKERRDDGPLREYAAGNRLVRRGDTTYEWDAAGSLIRKVTRRDQGERSWEYTWNARGQLASVVDSVGERVDFAYDAFSRRVEKRVSRRNPVGLYDLVASTRFVWDGQKLAHEIRERALERGDRVVEERTYAFEDRSFAPMVHKQGPADGEGRWLAYVCDPNAAPQALVDSHGNVAWESDRSVWGSFEPTAEGPSTPFGFAGQYNDDETGLSYNRYRYYDPEAGRFISRDPIELNGGINVFGYDVNPLVWIDPLGLTHYATADINGDELRPANGNEQFDSTMDGSEFDALRTRRNPDGNDGLDRQICHTEQKACEAARNAGIGAGDTLTIAGTKPPCNNCKGAMNDLAADTGANVEYQWTDEGGNDRSWRTNQKKGKAARDRRERRRRRS